MLESSLQLGRVLGIRVGIHYTWFIIFALISVSLANHFQATEPDWSIGAAWVTAIITALLFFASIVLHELGHSVVALAHGVPVQSITLFIFGGVAQLGRDTDSPRAEFQIAIAGPIVSFALALIFHLLSGLFGYFNEQAGVALAWLRYINLVVAIFNLIPGFPLDGGRVFRAIVWGITKNAQTGMRWAAASGKLVAYALIGLGILIILQTGRLIDGMWMALIGWFLLVAAEASARQFTLEHLTRGEKARDIMRPDVPLVDAGLSIQAWLDDHVLALNERAFLTQDQGKVIGLVSLSDVHKVARDKWNTTSLREIMTGLTALHAVTADDSLLDIMQIMERHRVNQVPVLGDGEVLGWIDRDRLLRALRIHAELER